MYVGTQFGTCFMSSFGFLNFEVALRFLENLCTAVLISLLRLYPLLLILPPV